MRLHHYMTTAKWAEVVLRERRLKLSRFYEANDPFELNLIESAGAEPDTNRSAGAPFHRRDWTNCKADYVIQA